MLVLVLVLLVLSSACRSAMYLVPNLAVQVPPPDQARYPLTASETDVLTKYGRTL